MSSVLNKFERLGSEILGKYESNRSFVKLKNFSNFSKREWIFLQVPEKAIIVTKIIVLRNFCVFVLKIKLLVPTKRHSLTLKSINM